MGKIKVIFSVLGLLVSLQLLFVAVDANALSLVYNGYKCDPNSPILRATSTPAQSVYDVTNIQSESLIMLKLRGGLPQYDNDTGAVCILDAKGIGYENSGPNADVPTKRTENDVTAFFNGSDLVIVVPWIHYIGTSSWSSGFSSSGLIYPETNTLVYKLVPERMSFRFVNEHRSLTLSAH